MPLGTKIATCSYCGTRAALVLRGKERHELACSSCGAPLHEMKMLRRTDVDEPGRDLPSGKSKSHRPKDDRYGQGREADWKRPPASKRRTRKKKRKSLTRRFFEEAFDVIEDIFD